MHINFKWGHGIENTKSQSKWEALGPSPDEKFSPILIFRRFLFVWQ